MSIMTPKPPPRKSVMVPKKSKSPDKQLDALKVMSQALKEQEERK
jgi:hypothetical protein